MNEFRTSQKRMDPCNKLPHAKRFGEVIIGAYLKANDAVRLFATRCQHQNRCRGILANVPQDVQAIQLRKHPVEDEQIRTESHVNLNGTETVGNMLNRISLVSQLTSDNDCQINGIFNQE